MKNILVGLFVTISALAAETGTVAPYVPSDAERARWTMSDLRSLATAVEAYAIDHKSYPPANSFDALVPLIQPAYIKKAPSVDAWGHRFLYLPSVDQVSYRLISAGSDAKTDPASWEKAGPLSSFDEDSVVDSGSFTRPWPFL